MSIIQRIQRKKQLKMLLFLSILLVSHDLSKISVKLTFLIGQGVREEVNKFSQPDLAKNITQTP